MGVPRGFDWIRGCARCTSGARTRPLHGHSARCLYLPYAAPIGRLLAPVSDSASGMGPHLRCCARLAPASAARYPNSWENLYRQTQRRPTEPFNAPRFHKDYCCGSRGAGTDSFAVLVARPPRRPLWNGQCRVWLPPTEQPPEPSRRHGAPALRRSGQPGPESRLEVGYGLWRVGPSEVLVASGPTRDLLTMRDVTKEVEGAEA